MLKKSIFNYVHSSDHELLKNQLLLIDTDDFKSIIKSKNSLLKGRNCQGMNKKINLFIKLFF